MTPATSQRRLVVFWDGHVLTHTLPREGTLTIGRSKGCEIAIDDASVSRRHALLHLGVTNEIEDLGSSNGVSVGGARIAANVRTPIPPGAVVAVGRATLVLSGANASDAAEVGAAAARAHDGGESDSTMSRVARLVELVAPTRLSVIILGETGVGKEVMARDIHRLSDRSARPFVGINCASLGEQLLESELFGHERGAFTGAVQTKLGMLETADGGTVLLDEVGEMPASAQAKLLRVLETREVKRLGAVRPRVVDVRFIAATNRDLAALARDKQFRADLLFRLDGVTVTIPPLRTRREEIISLAARFVEEAAHKMGTQPPPIERGARDWLEAYDWPGNVRELRNVVERAVVLSRGAAITVAHVNVASSSRGSIPPPEAHGANLFDEVEALERRRIVDALDRARGNQTKAAEMLGISRRTLVGRLDAYGLPRPRRRDETR